MASQRILWVALPDGFTVSDGSGRARLSVFVSPQLQPDAASTLAPFDFLDWPSRIASEAIELEVRVGDVTIPADIVSRAESSLWTALFDANTFVRPHETDATSPIFSSYPAARMRDLLEASYQELGTQSPLHGASSDRIPAAFAEIRDLFGTAPPGLNAGDDSSLSERERRELLARELFRPDSADEIAERVERLVDLARSESTHNLGVDGTPGFVPIVPDTGGAASTIAQFMVYHRQPGGTAAVGEDRARDPRLDFHQRVTALTEYPKLLRLLGLVIDLELDPADIPEAGGEAPGSIRVIPRFTTPTSVETTSLAPDTAYVFERERVFTAAPARPDEGGAEAVSGLLNLGLPVSPDSSEHQFRILQVDVDSAGLRALDLLARALSPQAAPERAREFSLPPLRSGGVSITREGSAQLLHEALSNGRRKIAALAAGEPLTLFAEDLIRGFRVDVGDPETDEWRSLHEREGTYKFLQTQANLEITDEGCVQASLVQPDAQQSGPGPSAPDPSLPNYVSESLFLWQGWSLAASRPGEPLPQPEAPAETTPGGALGLEVSFRPPRRSLPRLRFGRSYALRVRLVDLAGNGLDVTEANRVVEALGPAAPVLPHRGSGDEFRFRRFEVVPAPLVFPRVKGEHGESVERVVLRSNHDLTPEAFASQHAAARPQYALSGERHIAPPKTWQLLAEMLGRFDAAIGTGTDHDRMHDLAAREQGPKPDDAVHPEPAMEVDWLPDPLAAGASFQGLPGAPETTTGAAASAVTIDFGPPSAWPDLSSFRLRLAEGSGAPAWDAAERVLTVPLRKGETSTVRLSCHLADASALELLGMWQWMVQGLQKRVERGELAEADFDTRREELEQLALLGLSTMLTPYRELTLVHAVQQPVEPPQLLSFAPVRLRDSTFVYTRGRGRVHAPSTGTVELTAAWTEKLDDPQEVEPADVDFEAQVFASPYALPDTDDDVAAPVPASDGSLPAASFDAAAGVVEFPGPAFETLLAAVGAESEELWHAWGRLRQAALQAGLPGVATVYDFRLEALSALAEGHPSESTWARMGVEARALEAQIIVDVADLNPPDVVGAPHIPESVGTAMFDVGGRAGELAASAEAGAAELVRFQGRHEFGDTRYRQVSYRVVGTTRFGECFDPQTPDLALTRPSNVVTVDVPSSSRPAPPSVQYIVPAFAWERAQTGADGSELTSRRRGGLRVYLDRPWYSSGDGELLGVVVAANDEAEEFLRSSRTLATQVGRDPLWTSPRTKSMPTPADFRNAAVQHPAGSTAALTNVLGYPVQFDGRGRCFCDIELTPRDSYYPFVRLALVRFQPHSLRGVESSNRVRADFAQLVPDRAVTVVRGVGDDFTVTVTGRTHESPTNPAFDPAAVGTRVRVSVQERIPGTSDDAGWLPAGGEAVVTTQTGAPTGMVLWSGTVTLPPAHPAGRFRLLIEELETYHSLDPLTAAGRVVDRVVFAETVVI